ncbi:MAG: glycosyltransferase [Candidatus Saccharibacteria bacterium]|nr:glycosyltransferase [Candidatus Saccharibacteria bacterium]
MVKTRPPEGTKGLKVAIAMDWLDQIGGAEQVLIAIHEIYPEAPIYTSVYRPKKLGGLLQDADIRTGWLNIFPVGLRRFLGPLRQRWFSHLNLSRYDLVISVTGAEAKAVKTASRQHKAYHLCYCHVPTQYYWQLYDDYLKHPGFGILDPLARLGLKLFVKPMRKKDYQAAQRPDQIITISKYAATQIKQYYNREAKIINPPVNLEKFSTGKQDFSTSQKIEVGNCQIKKDHKNGKKQTPEQNNCATNSAKSQTPSGKAVKRAGFITTSRQVTWKRLDLCIKACLETGEPLTIIGEGPEHDNLLKLANNSDLIQFFPRMTQEELETFLRRAKGYLFPSREPFGIAPVEALAAGCPVIAFGEGGALDYIEPGKNGLLFSEQTVESLAQAIRDFGKMQFSAATIRKTAEKYDKPAFMAKLTEEIHRALSETPAK